MIQMRSHLRALADRGRAVLVSSHQLGEVVHMADDLVVIAHGRLQFQGPMSAFAPDGDLEDAYLEATR
jgi:ABC-2 type transport system ATP-binding protein